MAADDSARQDTSTQQRGQRQRREDGKYDLVLFGATGFTGRLTAEYLAGALGGDGRSVRWAIAGRNRDKLVQLRDQLAESSPDAVQPDVTIADISDEATLRQLAESANVVITTVGPYLRYGEPLVAACAAAGTDYVDLTGEPEFVDRMYLAYHDKAASSGARLVHCCGFDSIPHDMGVYFTVAQLPADVPLRIDGYLRASGTASGGTFESAMLAFSRLPQYASVARERRRKERRPEGRRIDTRPTAPHYQSQLSAWALPLPTIDPQVVGRSAAALDRYGPDFAYHHYAAVHRLPVAVGMVAGVSGMVALAQIPPVRRQLVKMRPSGSGPSSERIAKGWFRVRFEGEGGGQRVVTEVSGGDPGYGDTAKMLAEAALCLAYDDLPPTAGQVTTAAAMGDALVARLQRAGIRFSVLEPASVGG